MTPCNWIPNLALLKIATSLHVLGLQLGLGTSLFVCVSERKTRMIAAGNMGAAILFYGATQLFMPEQLRIAFAQTALSLKILWILGLVLYFLSALLPKGRISRTLCRVAAAIGTGFALWSVCLQDGLGGAIASNWAIPMPELGVLLRLTTVIGASYLLGALMTCTKKGLPLSTLLTMAWMSGLGAAITLVSSAIGFVERIDGIANNLLKAVGFGWAIFALGLLFFSKLSRGNHLDRQVSYAVIPVAYLITILSFWGPSLLKLPAASIEGYYANGHEMTESRVFRRAQFLPEGASAEDRGQKMFRRQCASCHGERGPWKLAKTLNGWERKRISLFLESARESDQPSSKIYGTMPPLCGSDEEIEALGGFLFDEAR